MSGPSHGAAATAGTITGTASRVARIPRWEAVAPRDRTRAVSVERVSTRAKGGQGQPVERATPATWSRIRAITVPMTPIELADDDTSAGGPVVMSTSVRPQGVGQGLGEGPGPIGGPLDGIRLDQVPFQCPSPPVGVGLGESGEAFGVGEEGTDLGERCRGGDAVAEQGVAHPQRIGPIGRFEDGNDLDRVGAVRPPVELEPVPTPRPSRSAASACRETAIRSPDGCALEFRRGR